MSEIWRGLIDEVFPLLPDWEKKPIAFFDLADPEKRTKTDIADALVLIGAFQKKFKTILGLNEKELFEIADVLDIDAADLHTTTQSVYEKLGIECLVVHPTKEAVCCANGRYFHVNGPFCPRPVLTTGAGDNFNAGFCFGQALDLDPLSSLLLGVSTSGYYVRHGKSPDLIGLLAFLRDWNNDRF
jgi:sugar/nucleoside kinase (ribokinase family)